MNKLYILIFAFAWLATCEAKSNNKRASYKFDDIWAKLEKGKKLTVTNTDIAKPSRSDKKVTREHTKADQSTNPCAKTRCKSGKECVLDDKNQPKCVCIQECPTQVTIDDAVCGSNNKTYESECALWRTRCLGSKQKKLRKKIKHLKVKYLGPCKELESCPKSELAEYPIRMRAWLKNIFLEMYDTPKEDGGLSDKQRHHGRKVYSEREKLQDYEESSPEIMQQQFAKFYPYYRYPIHWKFAQLDRKPKNNMLSKRELEPLRAPLIPMEHCTKAFFKRADKNKDKMISLQEWGEALGLKDGDIDPVLAF